MCLTIIQRLLLACCPPYAAEYMLLKIRFEIGSAVVPKRSIPLAAAVKFMTPGGRRRSPVKIWFVLVIQQAKQVVRQQYMQIRIYFFEKITLVVLLPSARQRGGRRITFINNNSSVKLTGVDCAIIGEINRDSIPGAWQSFVPVYRMPADTDLKNYQPAQPGVYKIIDSAVVFTPDTPFASGKTYFMRYYQFDNDANLMGFLTEKKRLRKTSYIDLIFK